MQSGGIMLLYTMQLHYIKEKMSIAIKSNQVQFNKIVLSKDQYLKNKIGNKEISIEDEIYDIKSVKHIDNNTVELRLIKDKEEISLIKNIKAYKNKSNTPKNKAIFKYPFFWFKDFPNYKELYVGAKPINFVFSSSYNTKLSSTIIAITTPPPQLG
jgi:hypothetical protein